LSLTKNDRVHTDSSKPLIKCRSAYST